MKLAVFGATGMIGGAILKEAIDRGHAVTAIARSSRRLREIDATAGAIAIDLLAEPQKATAITAGHDALVSALRPPPGRESDLVPLTLAVLDAAKANDLPVFVTGGAANLVLDELGGPTVLAAPDFLPASVRPIAEACAALDDALRRLGGARWTCLRPPPMLAEGPRTGRYTFGTDRAITDGTGRSGISHGDFAAAMLDLVEAGGPRTVSDRPSFLTVGWTDNDLAQAEADRASGQGGSHV